MKQRSNLLKRTFVFKRCTVYIKQENNEILKDEIKPIGSSKNKKKYQYNLNMRMKYWYCVMVLLYLLTDAEGSQKHHPVIYTSQCL